MAEIIVERDINAPVEKLFTSWSDEFADIYKFHPGLNDSYILPESPTQNGIGALRQCNMSDGKNWIKEKLVEIELNKRLVIDIYDFSMPMKSAKGIFEFKAVNANLSRIRFIFRFTPGMGILGKIMTPMMKIQYKRILQSMLDNNASYVETGKQANETKKAA